MHLGDGQHRPQKRLDAVADLVTRLKSPPWEDRALNHRELLHKDLLQLLDLLESTSHHPALSTLRLDLDHVA